MTSAPSPPTFPARALAGYLAVVAILNALAWLARIVPTLGSQGTPEFLEGPGVTTHPVYVQDLAFWIPLMLVSAVLLWRRRAWSFPLVGAMLTMLVVESVGIAIDQWFGHAADPLSPAASATAVPVFAGVAIVGLIPLYFFFRGIDGDR